MRNYTFSIGLLPIKMSLEFVDVDVTFQTNFELDDDNIISNYSFEMTMSPELQGTMEADIVDARDTLKFRRNLSAEDEVRVNDVFRKLSNDSEYNTATEGVLHPAIFNVSTPQRIISKGPMFGLKVRHK
jgi:hypothetical protein